VLRAADRQQVVLPVAVHVGQGNQLWLVDAVVGSCGQRLAPVE